MKTSHPNLSETQAAIMGHRSLESISPSAEELPGTLCLPALPGLFHHTNLLSISEELHTTARKFLH